MCSRKEFLTFPEVPGTLISGNNQNRFSPMGVNAQYLLKRRLL